MKQWFLVDVRQLYLFKRTDYYQLLYLKTAPRFQINNDCIFSTDTVMIYMSIDNGRHLKYNMCSFYKFIFQLVCQYITLTPQKMFGTRIYCLTTTMRKLTLLLHNTR
jgi:hypothetical protein